MKFRGYCLLFLPFLGQLTVSQYFEFQDVPIPESKHILSLYRYFAYVADDPPPLSIKSVPIGLKVVPLSAYSATSVTSEEETTTPPPTTTPTTTTILSNQANETIRLLSSFSAKRSDASHDEKLRALLRRNLQNLLGNDWNNSTSLLEDDEKPPIFNLGNSVTLAEDKQQSSTNPSKYESQIIFDNLRFTGPSADKMKDDPSIQVTITSFTDFWTIFLPRSLDPSKPFCCNPDGIADGVCQTLNTLIRDPNCLVFESVSFTQRPQLRSNMTIPKTDSLILLFSNCGDAKDVRVSGAVYLHNYYGYLPGIDVPKASFYILLTLIYLFLLFIWGILALRYRDQLIHIHGAMACVLGMGVLESMIWFCFYYDWNQRPERWNLFLGVAVVVTVIKNICSFMLVLAASLGWGITKPALSSTTKKKMILLIIAYIIFDSARQIMTQFRLSHELSFALVLSCIIPVSTLHGIIFFWIFTSLGGVMEELKEKRQEKKLQLFSQFWILLMTTMIAAIVFLSVQVFSMSDESPDRWRDEWIFSDVSPHGFFVAVLFAMMILWRPSRHSKAMAYSTELPSEDPLEQHEAASHFDKVVFGRKQAYKDANNNHHPKQQQQRYETDQYMQVEMTNATVNKVPNVWGKTQNNLTDLDYDEDDTAVI